MSFGIAFVAWMVILISLLLDAAGDAGGVFNADTGNTGFGAGNEGRLDILVEGEQANVFEVGIAGFEVGIPLLNPAFFTTMWTILSWDMNFFSGTYNIIRMIGLGIAYAFSLMFIRDLGPYLLTLIEVLGRAMGQLIGGFGEAVRGIARLR